MSGKLSTEEKNATLELLEVRFNENMHRHETLKWTDVVEKLEAQPEKLWSLAEMERTGGEPDLVGDEFVYFDCSLESPKGRRSVCYDLEALEKRKKNQPKTDATSMAEEMGIKLLTEEDYRKLQTYEEFDLKTSSWVDTPAEIRKIGGAIFCDRRYDTVFTYHNGADSYYAGRGFRGSLQL